MQVKHFERFQEALKTAFAELGAIGQYVNEVKRLVGEALDQVEEE